MSTNTTSSSDQRRRRRGPARRGGPRPPHRSTEPAEPAALAYEAAIFDPAPIPYDLLPLDPRLLSGIKDLGWSETRPVQSGVIPLAIQGGDVIACAETGTGKTAAFLVPILQRFLNEPAPQPPRTRALVLAPTRELAVQIEDQVQGLTYHTTISSVAVYGGVPMDAQERALKANVDIVVATPGRLMDHMRHDSVNFTGLEILVLDEADRMLDMGFWPDVQRILAQLPAQRQTLLFSATMPAEVLKLTQEFLRDPKYVQVGRRGGPAATISHAIQEVAGAEKTKWLADWLRKEAIGPVLVFCRTKIGADRLATRLSAMGIRAAALHADRTQQQRMAAVEGFRTGTYPVLVATDVAARGLDIEGIAHVVNFEVPDTPEAYVHRVGRTGRAESTGSALTLVAPEELRALKALEKAVGVRLQ
ncbi:MAG TPA: DEAD/DEAH box helicase [Vicinamibacterales bacterium]|nr:DEAD/DEAH box helicase [Vicinamibacterales bacterium]